MRLNRTYSLIAFAFLALTVAVLQAVAHEHYLYWSVWWYDIMMHGLGGLLIGLLSAWFITFPAKGILSMPYSFFVIGSVIVIGILWEVFEYTVGTHLLYNSFDSYLLDTVYDVGMDIAGGLGAVVLFKRTVHG